MSERLADQIVVDLVLLLASFVVAWLLSINAVIGLLVSAVVMFVLLSSHPMFADLTLFSQTVLFAHRRALIHQKLEFVLSGTDTVGREKNVIRGMTGLSVRNSIFLISCISTMRSNGLSSRVLLI